MKKFILSLGLIAMAFNLTNCAQYEEATPSVETKGDFALYASVSRTANDGLNTVWSTGDDLGVFHAVTDGTTYTKDGQFKLEDATTGRFLGNVSGTLDSQEEYDWYAMYPYSSYVPGPKNTGSGYMTIGCAASGTQTQTGNNSMAHIAGSNYPMIGHAYAVPANTSPSLTLTHASSLIEFEVTNKLAEAITISEIQFTAAEGIVGTFYINFADKNNVKYTNGSYVANTMTLAVSNGEEIAPGASAKFYAAIKPFTAKADDDLTIKVVATTETGSGVHEQDLTLSQDVTFSAGKIKTVKVNYTTEIESAEEHDWVNNAYNLVPSTAALSIGDKVVIVASGYNKAAGAQNSNNRASVNVVKNTENNTVDFDTKVVIFTVAAGKSSGCFAFKTAEGKYIYAAGGSSSNHLKEETSLSTKSSWTVSIVNGIATIKAEDSATTRNTIRYNDAATNGDLFSCYASGQADVSLYKLVGEYTPADPVIELTVSNTSLAYDATSGSATVTTAYATGWTITATSSESWISNLVYSNGAISFTSEANEGEERSATITVTATREGYDTVTKTFVITQGAKPSGDLALGASYSYTFSAKVWSANGAQKLGTLSWTLDGGGGYWGYDATKGQQFGSGSKPYKSMTLTTTGYEGGVKKIVINTSGASSISGSFTVTVGGKQIGAKKSLTSTATSYTLESTEMLSGDIVISYTQTSSKAIYIKSIAIN